MAQVNGSSNGKGGRDTVNRYITVELPAHHEGVGRALRAAYGAKSADLPADISALLDRLDRL